MKFPPEPKTKYMFDNDQDRRIFENLNKLEGARLSDDEEELVKFLYSQLETNWRDPLEEFVDKFLKEKI